jgi:hypothetical protein
MQKNYKQSPIASPTGQVLDGFVISPSPHRVAYVCLGASRYIELQIGPTVPTVSEANRASLATFEASLGLHCMCRMHTGYGKPSRVSGGDKSLPSPVTVIPSCGSFVRTWHTLGVRHTHGVLLLGDRLGLPDDMLRVQIHILDGYLAMVSPILHVILPNTDKPKYKTFIPPPAGRNLTFPSRTRVQLHGWTCSDTISAPNEPACAWLASARSPTPLRSNGAATLKVDVAWTEEAVVTDWVVLRR